MWTENILKTELFENDDVTIIRWFVCPSLPQTQIQNGGKNHLKDGGNNKAVSHLGSTKTLLCACSRVHSSVSAACDWYVFKFLRRSVDGKHFIHFLVWTKNIWCVFRVKPRFSNSSGVVWMWRKSCKIRTRYWEDRLLLSEDLAQAWRHQCRWRILYYLANKSGRHVNSHSLSDTLSTRHVMRI